MKCAVCNAPLTYHLDLAVGECGRCYFELNARIPIAKPAKQTLNHTNLRRVAGDKLVLVAGDAEFHLHAAYWK